MPRTRPSYPPEFRLEAVRLTRTSGQLIDRTAQDIGVCHETLRHRARQAEVDTGEAEGLKRGEREELRRLRRENRILRKEREILKQAAVGSTDRCNTSYGPASISRWTDGAVGQA